MTSPLPTRMGLRTTHQESRASGDPFEELSRLHFEGVGQFHDVEQPDVAFTALDSAHVVPMEIGQLGQLLLREASFEPKLAHALTKQSPRV